MADDFDPMEITLAVTEVLEGLSVPYLIGGSLASILYGMVRTTNDADLVAKLRREQVEPLASAPGSTFYLDRDAKLEWYRLGDHVSERQWRDVVGMIKARGERLDLEYLREWATNLGVLDLLEQALVAARA